MTDAKKTRFLKNNDRIGILNRGESAYRFIRSLKEYNDLYGTEFTSVAFYVPEERNSIFVKAADESLPLLRSDGSVVSPYMDYRLLMQSLKKTSCSAVWVGWGFVSEDSIFAEMIEEAGLVFIGPSSISMNLLGDKVMAKNLADRCGVPVLPWSGRPLEGYGEAAALAEQYGYPVIIKAANAGGGRGIRVALTPEELEKSYISAVEETKRITGNSVVFMEKYVETSRHLEVQVLADMHGSVSSFGVRDCSVQRRNQKIIEETPPANLDPQLLDRMEQVSRELIRAAGYAGAGTVEFIFDVKTGNYYFMEVNTRLQVEHPITEILYGVDLVKGQIDVAMGKKLSTDVRKSEGCVMEVRINAENPESGFSPSPGDVLLFRPPAGPGIRVDSGVEQYSSIPAEFDSMIAKIIVHGSDRREALARMKRALSEFRIKIKNGTTNKSFVLGLLDNSSIREGGVHTGFIDRLIKSGTGKPDDGLAAAALLSCSVDQYLGKYRADFVNFQNRISASGRPGRMEGLKGYEVTLSYSGRNYDFLVRRTGEEYFHISFGGKEHLLRYEAAGHEIFMTAGGKKYSLIITHRGDDLICEINGRAVTVGAQSGGIVRSPSPAVVLSVNTSAGKQVEKGELLLVLEAMKMEIVINAPESGTVTEILASEREQVAAGQPLVKIEASGSTTESAESIGPELDFAFAEVKKDEIQEWQERNILSLFLGYDSTGSPAEAFSGMTGDSSEGDEKAVSRCDEKKCGFLLNLADLFIKIEKLFVSGSAGAPGYSRPLTNAEMMTHFFRRIDERGKGLPGIFVENLGKALSCFPAVGSAQGSAAYALYNVFRSHSFVAEKIKILSCAISWVSGLEEKKDDPDFRGRISLIADDIIRHFGSSYPGLAEKALYARFVVNDRGKIESKKSEYRKTIDSLSEKDAADHDLSLLTDSGPGIVFELLLASLSPDRNKRLLGMKAAGLRFNRDREITGSGFVECGTKTLFYTASGKGKDQLVSFLAVSKLSEVTDTLDFTKLLPEIPRKQPDEIILLVLDDTGKSDPESAAEKTRAAIIAEEGQVFTIGIFDKRGESFYRSFTFSDAIFTETVLMSGFSPLQYRELRVYRYCNFSMKILHNTGDVIVARAEAADNPRDVRLIAFVDVSETLPERKNDGTGLRLIMLEHLFAEAVNTIREYHASAGRRLYWNTIIIHNRSLLGMGIRQLGHYGEKLVGLSEGTGLEKITVLTRRKRWSENSERPLQLDFYSVTPGQVTVRSGIPAEDAVKTADNFELNKMAARRKNTLYPYEIVEMLTDSGFAGEGKKLQGRFEEYDIEIPDRDKPFQKPVSVKGRRYGENKANTVFGIIENYDPAVRFPLRRVLVLSDPVKDMGSLAEPECRRVIAAIDLAESEAIPIEWIPVSSGARIDMESGTENLDWTARVLKRIIRFTEAGGEINIIVAATNVGAQSYWNSEATMLMHTKGLLVMTDEASMLLTGKKALDFSGSVSGENNLEIGGVEKIMGPNGQAQIRALNLSSAYEILFTHYRYSYVPSGKLYAERMETSDPSDRDITVDPYTDEAGQGFKRIGDIFSLGKNPERKKPFDIRQVMKSVTDRDSGFLERWQNMSEAETAVVWESSIGGYPLCLIGIESRPVPRVGEIPHDGPEYWNGGTLYPASSKKIARAINAFSGRIPVVILANLSGFDGSPESLRRCQLEYGAEIGRSVVNFRGALLFIVIARYHGGAYVVFSKALNPRMTVAALEGSFASVIGGSPAAAVVFPKKALRAAYEDERIAGFRKKDENETEDRNRYEQLFSRVLAEKQAEIAREFDSFHSVERAKSVGSIDHIISPGQLRPYIVEMLEEKIESYIHEKKERRPEMPQSDIKHV